MPAANELSDIDLDGLAELNGLRRRGPSSRLQELEHKFSARLGADCRLAVYGSLAPGRSNHHQLQHLRGEWHSGFSVTGDLLDRGWAAGIGYPALRWSGSSPRVAIELFVSDDLPSHWTRLDEFEGADYLRIVVPVFSANSATLANLYAMR